MAEQSNIDQSTFFFPLRTNVEHFRSQERYLGLRERVKQALLLYDRLLFQAGVYLNVAGPVGRFDLMRPFNPKYDSNVEFTDENAAPEFMVQIRPSNASPETPFTTILKSKLEVEFQSQFHTLFNEISSQGISDVQIESLNLTDGAVKIARDISKYDQEHLEFDQRNPFLQSKLIENLNLDLLLISLMQIPASIDGIHAPLLAQKTEAYGDVSPVSGFYAISTIVPYFGNLSWEQIGELRQEQSLSEFRKRLVEIEKNVRTLLGDAPEEELRQQILLLHQDDLLAEINALQQKREDIIQNVILEIAGNIFPPLGVTKSVLDTYDDLRKLYESNRSWLAMLMKLQSMKE
jgi:hypothetical protein